MRCIRCYLNYMYLVFLVGLSWLLLKNNEEQCFAIVAKTDSNATLSCLLKISLIYHKQYIVPFNMFKLTTAENLAIIDTTKTSRKFTNNWHHQRQQSLLQKSNTSRYSNLHHRQDKKWCFSFELITVHAKGILLVIHSYNIIHCNSTNY